MRDRVAPPICCPFFVVGKNVGHGLIKIRVCQRWHGDEKVVGKIEFHDKNRREQVGILSCIADYSNLRSAGQPLFPFETSAIEILPGPSDVQNVDVFSDPVRKPREWCGQLDYP